jgi:hypothetical protein
MANQPQEFRHHQIVRAFRAAEAAGVRDPTVRVVLPNGTEFHIGAGGKPAPPPVVAPKSKARPPALPRRPVR